jgi:aerobic-type carbon monoxide dehydrogenase small subunit (CoxS/CutS family)
MTEISFILNGKPVTVLAEPADRLLDVLREKLHRKKRRKAAASAHAARAP